MNPRVSVVIPTYNAAAFIGETLASVLAQEGVDFEVLVLDDASTDGTLERVREFADARVRIHGSDSNRGRVANANRGFDLAQGEFIARIDHDDVAVAGRLAAQVRFLDANPGIAVVGSQIRHFGMETLTSELPLDDGGIKARFISGSAYLANPSTMFRRELVQRNFIRYDPNLSILDDLAFWFDMTLAGARFANLPEVLTLYRIHPAMTSMNLDVRPYDMARRRFYARLLPEYFPRLTGRQVRSLLALFVMDSPVPDAAELKLLHEAAGCALQEVDARWGLDVEEAKRQLVGMFNLKRAAWAGSVDIAAFDAVFYEALNR